MTNERANQFKILLSDEEKAWLEEIAADRGLSASDVLRVHIRESHTALLERLRASDDHLADIHRAVLQTFADDDGAKPYDDIAFEMSAYNLGTKWEGLPPVLAALARNGFLTAQARGYVLTPAGRAYVKAHSKTARGRKR